MQNMAGGIRQPSLTEAKVLEQDRLRCEAITTQNHAALASMMHEDLVHIHQNGRVQNKQEYLDGIAATPRKTWRGDCTVRAFGDVAVQTGVQFNEMQDGRLVKAMVTQVWVKDGAACKQASFQSCLIREQG
jgi:hypothetical protein